MARHGGAPPTAVRCGRYAPAPLTHDPPTFDLQSHSVHSDGALEPAEVVAAAARAGVELLALSDHDTASGVEEARLAARTAGINLVSAVEVSAIDRGGSGAGDLHILGYGVDHMDNVFEERLSFYREDREQRAWAMARELRELGFEVDERPLRRREARGESIGRPHLAAVVVSHPANAERLAAEHIDEPSAFLEAYLIEGRPAFLPRNRPSIVEAIRAIHDAGGVAVWAHPFWDVKANADVLRAIDRFVEIGLDGVECFYVTHTREQCLLLADRCDQVGLLSTGSSDFHGPKHREFSRFRAHSTHGREAVLGPIAS
jgi:predicted metal-dependent phosphoesterase TrpH